MFAGYRGVPQFCQKVQPTTGTITACKVAALNNSLACCAVGKRIFGAQLDYQHDTKAETELSSIKEDTIPKPVNISDWELSNCHKTDIQFLSFSQQHKLLASIDSTNHIFLYNIDKKETKPISLIPENTLCDRSWAGVDWSENTLASAHHYLRQVTLFDVEKASVTNSFSVLQNPTSIRFVNFGGSSQPLILTTESDNMCLYDIRAGNKQLFRIRPTISPLYCADISNNSILCGGESRCIHIYESRKLSPVNVWNNASKYAIVSLTVSKRNPNLCYFRGLYSDLISGDWNNQKPHSGSFMCDSKWVGISLVENNDKPQMDSIIGFSDIGSVYSLQNVERLHLIGKKREKPYDGNPVDMSPDAKRFKEKL